MIVTEDIYDNLFFSYKFNYVLVLAGFLRLFFVMRLFLERTSYMTPRASRNCTMYGCRADYLFAIKCLFKNEPLYLMGVVFSVSIVMFALGFRVSEGPLSEVLRERGLPNNQDLNNFWNSLWLTIITMTTVGYGDFYPRTSVGRAIDVMLVIWGIFIVSLMIVVLTNTLSMDSSETRALIVLNRLDAKKIIKEKAANLIAMAFRRWQAAKRARLDKDPNKAKHLQDTLLDLDMRLKKNAKEFADVNREIHSMY